MTLEELWEQHNSKVNIMIAKLSVGAAITRDAHVKQAHEDLIDFSHWFDEQMETITSQGAD
jgi:hypothetical protein